jgi:glutamine synthetase
MPKPSQQDSSAINTVFKMIKEHQIVIVDLKFSDMPGQWQHLSVNAKHFSEDVFINGIGFDGSSIRGFRKIHESDMILIPDPATVMLDEFTAQPTLSIVCDIQDPITREPYLRDPRRLAKKAEAYLKSTGMADTAYFGPEPEFFILDNVRYDQSHNFGYYYLDSDEGFWNSGSDAKQNLGHKPRYKEGYYPVSPIDSLQDVRTEMVLALIRAGIDIEVHHHEVATAGQTEIDMKRDSLVNMADKLMTYKYVTKNIAKKFNKTVTFMPKPIFGDNGSGMHVHQSLWKAGKPLFAGNEYAGLSKMALYYIGGLLKHAPALCALTNPTTNSYKRLVPGFEAPVNLAYSQRNRSASIRIPMYSSSSKAKRIEFRCPDPTCNPYIAFSAMLMAGLDGIINKIDPGDPLDKDIYELSPQELADVPSTPGSLEEALVELQNDQEFLLRGDVFPKDLIDTWIEYKFAKEVKPMRLRPHPFEFIMYYDA